MRILCLGFLLLSSTLSVQGQEDPCLTAQLGSLHPHPSNCSRYFKCDNKGQAEDHDCGEGTAWSTEKQYCDYSYNVACEAGLRREFEKCSGGKWRCGSGECVLRETQCDGVTHCEDGSDEAAAQCAQPDCADHLFQCKSVSQCVSSVQVCNGASDCQDGSDERSPPCPGPPPPPPGSPPSLAAPPSTRPRHQPAAQAGAAVQTVTTMGLALNVVTALYLLLIH